MQAQLQGYSRRDLGDRKHWYVSIADAYDQTRPQYPQEICDRILALSNLPPKPKLLEIGCGPGTTTANFARHGLEILCLEPNPAFYDLAQRNCAPYTNVEIRNLALEEWPIDPEQFDLVYAANAFHWIPPEVGYPKVAAALKPGGSLALLWNMTLEPSLEVHQQLKPLFVDQAPIFSRYEGPGRQAEILIELGQMMVDSGRFERPRVESMICEHHYGLADYLALLSTYSHYIELPEEVRSRLFASLQDMISLATCSTPNPVNSDYLNGEPVKDRHILHLFNRCGFQIGRKASR